MWQSFLRVFGALLIAISAFYLSFIFLAGRVEKRAENYAQDKVASLSNQSEDQKSSNLTKFKRNYLDSVANKKVFLGYTYKDIKKKQLGLGLDLQGGMSVVLQVSSEDILKAMAGRKAKDPAFKKALETAVDQQKNSGESLISLFGSAFEQQNPGQSLAYYFTNSEYQDKINSQTSNADILKFIGQEADAAVEKTYQILNKRIDQFGVTSPSISYDKPTGRISVELPGVDDDPERVRRLLQATAKLEFWEMETNSNDLVKSFDDANKILKDLEKLKAEGKTNPTDTTASASTDSTTTAQSATDTTATAKKDSLTREEFKKENPMFGIFSPSQRIGDVAVGYIDGNDTTTFNSYLKNPTVKGAFPSNIAFAFDAKPILDDKKEQTNVFAVYAFKSRFNDEMRAPLEGDAVTDARHNIDGLTGQTIVEMQMNQEGARKWRALTAENLKKPIAISLDNRVYSAPTVQSEIAGGRSQITGNFNTEEAQDLANILKAGKLPAPARIIEEGVVGPSLGQASINSGLMSIGVALLAILGFMILYYSSAGALADIGLVVNLFLMLGALTSIGAVLTLPGMAGIILTMGIAVDANVIIFERIREELRRGSELKKAISDGYLKSLPAIIDGNIATLIAATVLYIFGLGPVKGFSTVLIVGIITSLFSVIGLTRLIVEYYLNRGKSIQYSTKLSEGAFRGLSYDFIGKRKIAYAFSIGLTLLGLISFFTRGFEYGVDFSGGRTYVVQLNKDASSEEVRSSLTAPLGGMPPVVRVYGGNNQMKITTGYLIENTSKSTDSTILNKMYEGLKPYINNANFAQFTSQNIKSSQKVEATIADDINRSAIKSTIIALLGIFIYILIRFRKWQFALGTVVATIHDALVMLTIFSLLRGVLPFSLEIDQHFVAAFLTIIGYSINDTVVVFDRIREYLRQRRGEEGKDRKALFNEAINDTLSRTLMTSFITFMVVTILFLFGGEVVRGFAFALMVGIIIGTYSSIFIASSLVIDLPEGAEIPDSLIPETYATDEGAFVGNVPDNTPIPFEDPALEGANNTASNTGSAANRRSRLRNRNNQ